jgi:hypothetical protein
MKTSEWVYGFPFGRIDQTFQTWIFQCGVPYSPGIQRTGRRPPTTDEKGFPNRMRWKSSNFAGGGYAAHYGYLPTFPVAEVATWFLKIAMLCLKSVVSAEA